MTEMKPSLPSKNVWKPHSYQSRAVDFLKTNPGGGAALFLDPGLGKTSVTLQAICDLKAAGEIRKVLIIAPKKVCETVWGAEQSKWVNFKGLKVVYLHGKNKNEYLKLDADIFTINPEGLMWLIGAKKDARGKLVIDRQRWVSLGFDALVIDELTKFKHVDTTRFKQLKPLLPTFKYRWGLTGSPASNTYLDIFGQAYVLDLGKTFGTSYSAYRDRYFTRGYDGFSWRLRPGAEAEITEKLNNLALRMAAEDYLDMPEMLKTNITVTLPAEAQKQYKTLQRDMLLQLDNRDVVAANAASLSMKCRQFASGGLYSMVETVLGSSVEKSRCIEFIHHAKTDALVDLVEELQGQPLLVAYEFEHDLVRIREKLGSDVPHIGGGVPTARVNELVEKWNRGEIPVLLGQPSSMGHGLNMQKVCKHVAFYTLTWNYELYDQFIRRVYRQGNDSPMVHIYHIIAKDTIDELILQTIDNKKASQDGLFSALVEFAKKEGFMVEKY